MGQTILLTLGRLPKGLELARCLSGTGHRVIVADPFGWHLSRPSRAVARSFKTPAPAQDQSGYLDALIEIARAEAVDLVIPVSEEVMHVSLLAGRLPEGCRLFSPPHDRLQTLHDKSAFIDQVKTMDLRAPETCLGDDPAVGDLMARGESVAKPRFGCSGAGLHMFEAGAELPGQLRTSDWVIQRRLRGDELSTLSFCRDGELLGHVVYRGLIMSGTVAVCFERVECEAVDDWVRQFAWKTGYTGFLAFDFIRDADGLPWPLECNPRLTSGIHFMDHEDLAELVTGGRLDHMLRLRPQQRFQEGHTALTMAYGDFLRPAKFWRQLKTIASARDVLWSSQDPFVFPLMTPMSWPVLRKVMFNGRSFGEAATLDIEWLPDAAPLSADRPPAREAEPAKADDQAETLEATAS